MFCCFGLIGVVARVFYRRSQSQAKIYLGRALRFNEAGSPLLRSCARHVLNFAGDVEMSLVENLQVCGQWWLVFTGLCSVVSAESGVLGVA